MSFPSFKYTEIIEETWETSTMKEYFEEHRFLFVIYCENNDGDYVFRDSFFWRMPTEDLEGHFRKVWEETVTRIKINKHICFLRVLKIRCPCTTTW